MIVLGIILLIVGMLLHVPVITTLGTLLVLVGAVLFIMGSVGRPLAGRRHYW